MRITARMGLARTVGPPQAFALKFPPKLTMLTRRLDLDDLLREAPTALRPEDRACGSVRDP